MIKNDGCLAGNRHVKPDSGLVYDAQADILRYSPNFNSIKISSSAAAKSSRMISSLAR
jgi:hypothetical protein